MRWSDWEYKPLPYISDIDDDVQVEEYITAAKKFFPRNLKGYKRVDIPSSFNNDIEKEAWEVEQIRRCIEGHNDMCGKMYFYFNFCKIIATRNGRISPDYRVVDHLWFELLESCRVGDIHEGMGVVCVKRRRSGFSWKAACDALHDALFTKYQDVGMDSKTEEDSKELFAKVQFLYDNLPDFLRISAEGGQTKSSLKFATKIKDNAGNYKYGGNQSNVFCQPPTDSAYEGRKLNKWISDEAGKKDNMMVMWSLTVDCLDDEEGRVGVPIIFGTAGDVDKGSAGLKELWGKIDKKDPNYKLNEAYNLIRFFVPGWAGKSVDKNGNDNVEQEVRKIIKERRAKKKNQAADYLDFEQKMPLNINEALQVKGGVGIGNIHNIRNQIVSLENNPPYFKRGYFRKGGYKEPEVVFEPIAYPHNTVGMEWRIYEDVNSDFKYIAGSDPVDHNTGTSDLSMHILKGHRGSTPPMLVASATGRPMDPRTFYDQCILAQTYFNKCKALIENNRNGMIRHYEYEGKQFLLKEKPSDVKRIYKKKTAALEYGARKDVNTEIEMSRLIMDYTTDYCDLIPEIELLEEFLCWGDKNTDRAISFAWSLVHLEDITTTKVQFSDNKSKFKHFGLKKSNGKIIRY